MSRPASAEFGGLNRTSGVFRIRAKSRPPAATDYAASAATLDGIDALAVRLGRDPAPLLRHFGFTPEALADPDAPISNCRIYGLVEA